MNKLTNQRHGQRGSSGPVFCLCILICMSVSSCSTRYDRYYPEFKRKMSDKDEVIVLVDTFLIGLDDKIEVEENRRIAASTASAAMSQLQIQGYRVNDTPFLFTGFMERTRKNYITSSLSGEPGSASDIAWAADLYDTTALTSTQAKAFMGIFEKLPHLPDWPLALEQQIAFAEISETGLPQNTISCFILVYGRDVSFASQLATLVSTLGFVALEEPLSIGVVLVDNTTGALIWNNFSDGSAIAGEITSKMNERHINQQLSFYLDLIPTLDSPQ